MVYVQIKISVQVRHVDNDAHDCMQTYVHVHDSDCNRSSTESLVG